MVTLRHMSLVKSFMRRDGHLPLHYDVAGDTHVGLVRTQNEDSYIYINPPHGGPTLLAVADGMGGHEFGEVASYLCMHYLLNAWRERGDHDFESQDDVMRFIRTVLKRANHHIFHVNKVLQIRWAMGTTATVGILWQQKLVIGHVGDSRCYRLRRRKLKLLTSDQNWQAEMVRHGILTEREAACHPLSNMLTNCVGALQNLRIDFHTSEVFEGDRFVLCSDGVSSMVNDMDIFKVLSDARSSGESVKRLVHLALRNGGADNITAVSLYV